MTAQDVYKQMLRDHVAPALRRLGFKGAASRGNFRYERGDYAGELRFQKSGGSTQQRVQFWILLYATYVKTELLYWDRTIADLARLWESIGDWTIAAGDPVEPLASEVLRAFHTYGWPALQAALDNPGYPPDRSVQWVRTFPQAACAGFTENRVHDLEAGIILATTGGRSPGEVRQIARRELSVPGGVTLLLTALERDCRVGARLSAALKLATVADQESVGQALRAAAAQDENLDVRWAARYALRLARLGQAKG